jgi:hypothetical protein
MYYWEVRYVRPILFTFFTAGAILFIKNFSWGRTSSFTLHSIMAGAMKLRVPLLIVTSIFMSLFHLYSRFYVFNNHDVLYFGWMQEAWHPGYSGPIRVPTEYPALMASNHLLPGALLSTMGLLLPSMNLVTAIDLRYLLICFVLAGLLIEIYKRNRKRFLTTIVVGFTLNIAYGAEIVTELAISSFVYVLLLGCIMLILIEFDSIGKTQRLILMFSLLLLAKAPIFLISAIVLMFLLLKNLKSSLTFRNFAIFLITFVNVIVWMLVPKSIGLGSGFPLPVGFVTDFGFDFRWSAASYHEILSWYVGHEAWFLNRFIHPPFIFIVVFILIVLKIYTVYFYLRKKIGLTQSSVLVLDIYMITSMLSGLLLRNSGSLRHQAHAYLLASAITFMVCVCYLSMKLKWKHLVPISIISVLIQIPTKYLPFFEHDMVSKVGVDSLTLSQAELRRISETEKVGKRQVYYSMHGDRLNLSNVVDYETSQVHLFIQGGG